MGLTPIILVLASPGDVKAERSAVTRVVDELNKTLARGLGFQFTPQMWETDASPGFHPGGPQRQIDEALGIEASDIVVGIFWKKFGTPVADADSGTEHELRLAIKAWRESREGLEGRKPQIMVYFKNKAYAPEKKSEADQWAKVLAFKEEFPPEGLWWSFNSTLDFERTIRSHLTSYLLRKPLRSPAMASVPDSEELPNREAYIDKYLDLIRRAKESIILSTSLFHKAGEVEEAKRVNLALEDAKRRRRVRVRLMVADGYDRLPGAIELVLKHKIDVRFDPAARNADVSYACADERLLILASRLGSARYKQSSSWMQIRSRELSKAVTADFESRWDSLSTRTLEQQLREAVPPVIKASTPQKVAEQLGISLEEVKKYGANRPYVIFFIGRPGSGKTSIARQFETELLRKRVFRNVMLSSDLPFLSSVFSNPKRRASGDFERTPDGGFFVLKQSLYTAAIEHLADQALAAMPKSDVVILEFARKSYVKAFDLLKAKGIDPDLAIYIDVSFRTACERNRNRALSGTTDQHYVSEREMKKTFEKDDLRQLLLRFGTKIIQINNDTEVQALAIRETALRVFREFRKELGQPQPSR